MTARLSKQEEAIERLLDSNLQQQKREEALRFELRREMKDNVLIEIGLSKLADYALVLTREVQALSLKQAAGNLKDIFLKAFDKKRAELLDPEWDHRISARVRTIRRKVEAAATLHANLININIARLAQIKRAKQSWDTRTITGGEDFGGMTREQLKRLTQPFYAARDQAKIWFKNALDNAQIDDLSKETAHQVQNLISVWTDELLAPFHAFAKAGKKAQQIYKKHDPFNYHCLSGDGTSISPTQIGVDARDTVKKYPVAKEDSWVLEEAEDSWVLEEAAPKKREREREKKQTPSPEAEKKKARVSPEPGRADGVLAQ